MTKTLSDSAANLEITKSDSVVRRTRLREFQAQLVERMQAAQRGGFSKLSQLGIIIGQQRYLLDLREAGEIVSATLLTNVPLTKDWYVGLSNIRGNLTSVVDLSRFQGFELTKLDNSCRIVGFAPSLGFNSGLLVSQVLGLRNLAEMEEIASGETDGNSQEWLQRRFRDRDGNVWHELSLAALVQNQDFLHIGL
ncbi:chemotaxis protein CheW [Undibacterium sp. FT79W]|uniref:chemotaxis protein CheW n=1 Tax=Undibacterium sp. FT79W TaxID=2762296 RepID=UPI00164AF297|nr:chemotaxis protein CheW [Undibacterium sp. FT79W]MBC3876282.1 chemotaxis protein CheW [Undibacterium sp. FT79W]